MTTSDIINLKIDEKAYGYARIYSSLLKEEFQRKRSYASLTALYALLNLLKTTDFDIQSSMTLFRNPMLNEEYEISDFYVNDYHIDVRVLTEGTSVLLPKIHFDNNITPDFYAVVKIDKELKTAALLGFIDTSEIEKEAFDYHYYSSPLNKLISYEEFQQKVKSPKKFKFIPEEHEVFQNSYLSLTDNEIDKTLKNIILKHLFQCKECRTEFCCFTGFEMVNCNIGNYPELLNDETLNIIGAQDNAIENFADKEETIILDETKEEPINLEEEKPVEENIDNINSEITTVSEQNDEINDISNIKEDKLEFIEETDNSEEGKTSSDVLDELFSDEEIAGNEENTEVKEIAQADIIQNASTIDYVRPMGFDDEYSEVKKENNNDELEIIQDVSFEDDLPENSEDLKLIDNEEELIEITDNTTTVENNQKVIVDYDETGEPVYSYITDIDNGAPEELKEEEAVNKIDEIKEIEDLSDNYIEEEAQESMPKSMEQYPIFDQEAIEYTEDYNSDTAENNGENLTEYNETEYTQDYSTENNIQDISSQNDTEIIENEEIKSENKPINIAESIIENEMVTETLTDDNTITEENSQGEYEEFEEYKDSDDDSQEDLQEISNNTELPSEEEYNDEESDEETDDEYDEESDEEYDDEAETPQKNKNLIPIALLAVLLLIGGGIGAFILKGHNSGEQTANNPPIENVQNNDNPEFNQEGEGLQIPDNQNPEGNPDGTQEGNPENPDINNQEQQPEQNTEQSQDQGQLTEENILPPAQEPQQNQPNPNNNIANIMTQAVNTAPAAVSLQGINWSCAPNLFTDNAFKSYLQKLDNTLKLNIKNNILNTAELPQNNNVTVKLAVDNNGNLIRSMISGSSGSKQIDDIVLQSINETLETEKTIILNDSAQKSDKYFIQVVIKF